MEAIILIGAGLIAGSFVNALVWRLKAQGSSLKAQGSSLWGRSQCPKCGHKLAAIYLVPVLSWLALRGRCRYCHRPISRQYPLVEALMAIVFTASYFFWPVELTGGQRLLFGSWLVSTVGLLALAVYDNRWQLLPNRLIYPTLLAAAAGRLGYALAYEGDINSVLWQWLLAVLIASGGFWLLYMVSSGRWIGYGDVRLGLIIGTVLAKPELAALSLLLASSMGSLVALALIAGSKASLRSRIAFGPFLILATAISLLFGQSVIDWYQRLLT